MEVRIMPNERYKIFTDMETKEENIVDIVKGEPLTINQTCDLLNDLFERNQALKKTNNRIEKSRTECYNQLGELLDDYEELTHYERLWAQMAYYFIGTKSLNDLDHKDFKCLKELAKGNEHELTDEEKQEVYAYLQAYHQGDINNLKE